MFKPVLEWSGEHSNAFQIEVWLLFRRGVGQEKQKATDQRCVMVAGVTASRQQKSHRLYTRGREIIQERLSLDP